MRTKKRSALTNIWINRPDLLILGEQTNHLNQDMIELHETEIY
ncbi:hypothetical protein FLJC2902T_27920 [Flavobacterium limnosediminis JC2902]|uniref:Uncharacterized protein n=1 Tax=Flavobacterium limnosediminis JC2902 TaxID=1341181 RepID=V6SIA3_9FLAO|nr:hypothetical protein [Flavobacterium limnosediminis]ESU26311.1 hypothetical protein FLJC2902T_27920 [Flavobacterium limnosediminis JC2902]